MWIGVTQRFRTFDQNLQLTDVQVDDGIKKIAGIAGCLDRHYYNGLTLPKNCLVIGSWGKGTATRPPRDIDMYFTLPISVYYRLQSHVGNYQSALLQEVKNVLGRTYPTTDMRGDGQVVVVSFNSINVEVVPVFAVDHGSYLVCNTHDGGSYMRADPGAELTRINAVDKAYNGNLRPIIKIIKAWQNYCSVPIKSFHIELVATEFLVQSPWRMQGYYYYDWLLRDFFAYLYCKTNSYVYAPGTNEAIWLGDSWLSRVETAYKRAVKACEYEKLDWIELAGEEWQKIFGMQVPVLKANRTLLTR